MGRARRRRSCSCEDEDRAPVGSPAKQATDKKRIAYEDGGVYEGAVKKGDSGKLVRHGEGTYIDSKGNKFEGQWEDDSATGYGLKTFACGDMHEGGYLKGKRHGNGVYIWVNGDRYNGQWRNGLMHGQGAFYWNHGDVYEGFWVNGVMEGTGKKTLCDGACYRGEFARGKANGWGEKTYPDGECYEGQYENDCRHGYGVYTWSNGDTYRGQWVAGVAHGQGRRINKNGVTIQGQWQAGKMNGDGVRVDSKAGNVYRGNFVDDEPHGEGVVTSDSYTYMGQFAMGMMHGPGMQLNADGSSYAGSFVSGAKTGYGEQQSANGNRYVGDFVDGKRHGWGIFFWRNSAEVHLGGWANNVPHGLGCVYMLPNENRPSVTIFHGIFKHGNRDGPGVYTDEAGQLQLQEWHNGKLVTVECDALTELSPDDGMCPFCGDDSRRHPNGGLLRRSNTHSGEISDSNVNTFVSGTARSRQSLPIGGSRDDSFLVNHRDCLFCALDHVHFRRSSIS